MVAVTWTVRAPPSSATLSCIPLVRMSVSTDSVIEVGCRSSSSMVPVAVSAAVTATVVPDTVKPTVNVSSSSARTSSVVATVKVCVSPAVPAKARCAVFSV